MGGARYPMCQLKSWPQHNSHCRHCRGNCKKKSIFCFGGVNLGYYKGPVSLCFKPCVFSFGVNHMAMATFLSRMLSKDSACVNTIAITSRHTASKTALRILLFD